MRRAYLIANFRKNTGKTTLAAHLAASWAMSSKRGALLDFDPQARLFAHFGVPVLAGMMVAGLEDEELRESAYRLEGDALWRANLDLYPWYVSAAQFPDPELLQGYEFILMDTPPHDLSSLLRALSVLWTLKRWGWDIQVLVPHDQCSVQSRETLNFLHAVRQQMNARFPVTLVPYLLLEKQELKPKVGIPQYDSLTFRSTPPFHVDASFEFAAHFGLTVFEMDSNNIHASQMKAIADSLMPPS
jgi:cellulose biosynthesis protein BcsQ